MSERVEITVDGVKLTGEDFRMIQGRPLLDRPVRVGAWISVRLRFGADFYCEDGYGDGTNTVPWWVPPRIALEPARESEDA